MSEFDLTCPQCESTHIIPAGIKQRSQKRKRCGHCGFENTETWFLNAGTLRERMERVWKERPVQSARHKARWI